MKLRIDITEADIALGKRGNARCCAGALAIRRATGCDDVAVTHYYIRLNQTQMPTPAELGRFILVYDFMHSGWNNPVSFDLEVPDA